MRIMIFGGTGMLGSCVFQRLFKEEKHQVYATVRCTGISNEKYKKNIIYGVDVLNIDHVIDILNIYKPEVVINCIGVIKQLPTASNPEIILPINSIFPHRLAKLCGNINARLIHISTDCVFSGERGNYVESDICDAKDLYGVSKKIGEDIQYKKSLVIRTSIIGHEKNTKNSLVEWFLSRKNNVRGYSKAYFSGLPACELAKVINDYIIPNEGLEGLYHISSNPISKYSLLKLIAETYSKKTNIIEDDTIVIDRTLNSEKFRRETGYVTPNWNELVKSMYDNYLITENEKS